MDPNQALIELRDLEGHAQRVLNESAEAEHIDTSDCVEILTKFVNYFGSLDGWLSSGGFLPASWEKQR